ncbi:Inhibitor of growth protein 2 [Trichinella britovi]|uniref:Inhibitor of growth protein 2 n=1 Tax=Trichinella britovi TaxID=45882 RepID=A0A0V1CLG7_TRIBR|nr:Inhibitor of growth protein 2 [Trichinella britovi]KRY50112.1 Inhibitor of growth protein 2 [Trichinella britovi]KRZ95767.1 Inhibitor of growth protein 2 [Trichinella sp. T8]
MSDGTDSSSSEKKYRIKYELLKEQYDQLDRSNHRILNRILNIKAQIYDHMKEPGAMVEAEIINRIADGTAQIAYCPPTLKRKREKNGIIRKPLADEVDFADVKIEQESIEEALVYSYPKMLFLGEMIFNDSGDEVDFVGSNQLFVEYLQHLPCIIAEQEEKMHHVNAQIEPLLQEILRIAVSLYNTGVDENGAPLSEETKTRKRGELYSLFTRLDDLNSKKLILANGIKDICDTSISMYQKATRNTVNFSVFIVINAQREEARENQNNLEFMDDDSLIIEDSVLPVPTEPVRSVSPKLQWDEALHDFVVVDDDEDELEDEEDDDYDDEYEDEDYEFCVPLEISDDEDEYIKMSYLKEQSDEFPVDLSIPKVDPVYCICQKVVMQDSMVACDGEDCQYQWFHFKCVNVLSKPRGKWYCPDCRGDRPNVPKIKKRYEKSDNE